MYKVPSNLFFSSFQNVKRSSAEQKEENAGGAMIAEILLPSASLTVIIFMTFLFLLCFKKKNK